MKRGSDRDTPGIAERRQLSTVTPRGGGLSERIFLSGNGPCPARTDKALFRTSLQRENGNPSELKPPFSICFC